MIEGLRRAQAERDQAQAEREEVSAGRNEVTPSTRALLLTNIPAPYRIPLFRELAGQEQLDLRVLFLAETEGHRSWRVQAEKFGFDHRFLPGWHGLAEKRELPIHVNRRVWKEIRAYDPQVVISTGYDSLAYWQAALYCRLFGKRYVLWNETTLLSTDKMGGPVGWLKRVIVSSADAYIATGTKAAQYLEHLGASPDRITVATNTVDMEMFADAVRAERAAESFQEARRRYPPLLILYSGQLIPRKGIETLLDALRELSDPEVGLIVLGTGPLEPKLRALSQEHKLSGVYFEGFQPYDALPRYYALADVCVLPSKEEVWGLVVNEALAGGAYVLCSEAAGAAHDLIEEPWNGLLFSPLDVRRLSQALRDTKKRIREIRERRGAISDRARREFSIHRAAKGITAAIEAARRA